MKKIVGFLMTLSLCFSMGLTQAAVYKINRVAANDTLNLRSAAGTDSAVVAKIPHNGQGVIATGREQQLGRSTWIEVKWSGKSGWVNKYYLVADTQISQPKPVNRPAPPTQNQPAKATQPVKSSVIMRCGGTEPFWSMSINESQMYVDIMDGTKFSAPVEFRRQSENNTSIAIVAGRTKGATQGAITAAFLQKVEVCSDSMSDKNYSYSITALLNGTRAVSGCCGLSNSQ